MMAGLGVSIPPSLLCAKVDGINDRAKNETQVYLNAVCDGIYVKNPKRVKTQPR
jgi:hypothetical protein